MHFRSIICKQKEISPWPIDTMNFLIFLDIDKVHRAL